MTTTVHVVVLNTRASVRKALADVRKLFNTRSSTIVFVFFPTVP